MGLKNIKYLVGGNSITPQDNYRAAIVKRSSKIWAEKAITTVQIPYWSDC